MKEKDDTHMPAAVSTDSKKSQQQGSSEDSEILSQPRRKGLELVEALCRMVYPKQGSGVILLIQWLMI
jgi:hypothetical protein